MGFKHPGTSREFEPRKSAITNEASSPGTQENPSVSSPDSSKIFAHHQPQLNNGIADTRTVAAGDFSEAPGSDAATARRSCHGRPDDDGQGCGFEYAGWVRAAAAGAGDEGSQRGEEEVRALQGEFS